MPIENYKRIESSSVEQHMHELRKQMRIFELSYVEKLFQKKLQPFEKSYTEKDFDQKENAFLSKEIFIDFNNLGVLLERYTDIPREFVVAHKEIEKPNEHVSWEDDREYESISKIYTEKIKEFYDADTKTWIEKTLSLLDKMQKQAELLKEKFPKKDSRELSLEKAGLLSIMNERGEFFEDNFKNTNYEFNKYDTYLQIHLKPLVEQQYGNPQKSLFSDDSFKALALNIVEKYPETKAIVAESWLLDSPIAERVGFKIIKKKLKPVPAFWGQFQNADGQLATEKIAKFLETGIPSHQVATGVIDTIDFLNKYLPKEKRGEITLKELNPEFDFKGFYDLKQRKFFNNLDNVTFAELEEFFKNSKYISGFVNTKEGNGLIEFFKKMKEDNISFKEIKEKSEYKKYINDFNEYIKSLMYKDKKVFIS